MRDHHRRESMSAQDDSISGEVLNLAIELCGGGDRVAAALGVGAGELARWAQGEGRPPSDVLFAALVLIEARQQQS